MFFCKFSRASGVFFSLLIWKTVGELMWKRKANSPTILQQFFFSFGSDRSCACFVRKKLFFFCMLEREGRERNLMLFLCGFSVTWRAEKWKMYARRWGAVFRLMDIDSSSWNCDRGKHSTSFITKQPISVVVAGDFVCAPHPKQCVQSSSPFCVVPKISSIRLLPSLKLLPHRQQQQCRQTKANARRRRASRGT